MNKVTLCQAIVFFSAEDLTDVRPENPDYDDVRAMVKILNFVREANVDDEIPPTSLVREFIGGNSFYRK